MSSGVHLMWITARAAGISALALASLSVAVGLSMGFRRRRGPDLRTVHEALSLATIAAIGLHGVALFLDPWLKPGASGVLVPFDITFKPVAIAAGIVAAYGFVVLGLSYYARGRIGPKRWRRLHRWTALFWVLAVGHGLTAGTDSGEPWFLVSMGALIVPAVALLLAKLAGGQRERSSELPAASPG